jgi:hypothetical protein
MTNSIQLTYTQCKQLKQNGVDLADFLERVNDQPNFMQFSGMGIDSIGELQAIIQSGCASNAHRSVFYHDAKNCMDEYGDDVLQYIEDCEGEVPHPPQDFSWSQLASFYLSCAVELWCSAFDADLDGVNWD